MAKSFLSVLLPVALVASGIFLISIQKSNDRLSDALSLSSYKEKLMLQDKESLRKELIQLKSKLDSLSLKRVALQAPLMDSKSIVTYQEQRIAMLVRSFEELNAKYDQVLDRQQQRFKKLTELSSTNTQLMSEIKNLSTKLAGVTENNQRLNSELSLAEGLAKDNIFIEPEDEEGKPCAIGNRVKKIVATLSLPSEIKSPVFKIFDPEGKPLPDQGGHYQFTANNEGSVQKMKKLEMTYQLSKKIGSGLYRVEIASEGKHIGNLLMRLK
jgi:chromosome segregation ATPase